MRIVAIIQARMGATRLPGKVLRILGDKSVLAHVIARVKTCPQLDAVVVATTDQQADAAVANEARKCDAGFFRGSEQDVLARFYFAARENKADGIVRITADCPLYDGRLLDQMLTAFKQADTADYLSNTLKRTFPRGLDTEIFTFAALEQAHRQAVEAHEHEHVTPYLYQHPELFRLRSFEGTTDLSELRWTLDTLADWQFMAAVYEALYRPGEKFSTQAVLKLLKERPELVKLNQTQRAC